MPLQSSAVAGLDIAGISARINQRPPGGASVHVDGDGAAYLYAGGPDAGLSECKHNLTTFLQMIASHVKADKTVIHLTSPGSDKGGRYAMALTKPYQGQRSGSSKPKNHAAMRAWLGTSPPLFGGVEYVVSTRAEADDTIGCAAQADVDASRTPYILTGDKDLRMLPGIHIDWSTCNLTTVPAGTFRIRVDTERGGKTYGSCFFWEQMLSGDAVDNIRGLPGIGPEKAIAFLKDAHTDHEAFHTVLTIYKQRMGDKALPLFCESAALLWIRRFAPENRFDFLEWLRGVDDVCPESFNEVLDEYRYLYGRL